MLQSLWSARGRSWEDPVDATSSSEQKWLVDTKVVGILSRLGNLGTVYNLGTSLQVAFSHKWRVQKRLVAGSGGPMDHKCAYRPFLFKAAKHSKHGPTFKDGACCSEIPPLMKPNKSPVLAIRCF